MPLTASSFAIRVSPNPRPQTLAIGDHCPNLLIIEEVGFVPFWRLCRVEIVRFDSVVAYSCEPVSYYPPSFSN